MNYHVGDFLIQIKNMLPAKRKVLVIKKTNYIVNTAEALKRMGYIEKIAVKGDQVEIFLIFQNKEPKLTEIKLVSKPGLRIYRSAEELRDHRGLATLIISTSKGVLSLSEALKQNLGGEVIAEII